MIYRGGDNMGWLWIVFVVIIILVVFARVLSQNINYSIGSGMFKNSENNLDEPEDISDKDYFDKDGMLK